jgi:hypothetical protein
MKKLANMLTAAVLLFSASSFAANGSDVKTNAKVAASFEKQFSSAQNVSWQKNNEVYFVTFIAGITKVEAAYTEEGELLATSKHIDLAQIPVAVSKAIGEKYQGYKVGNNAIEIAYNNEHDYYLTIANDKNVLKVKITESGDITVEQKGKR